jgi:cholest-4-en-3-one 26-monooxygenase
VKLSDVDLTDLDAFERGVPHEWFALLRREDPVHWHEEADGPGFWAITKYEDLKAISKRPETFSSERFGTLLREPEPAALPFIQNIMLNMDPPRHRQHRNLVNKAFRPRLVEDLRPRVRQLVGDIIDSVIERGECDFVDSLAAPLPMLVICEMMGVPEEDRRRVYEVGNRMVGFDDPELQEDGQPQAMNDAQAASAEMFVYADKLRQRASAQPGDDMASALVHAELDGHRLTEEEFRFFFLLLLIAGNETTRTVTTNGMISLLDNPDQLRLLERDPSLVPSAVEEILRYSPAVHCFRRTATRDTEVRGRRIRANDKLALWYPSANRDEDVFERPDAFEVRRSPNEHVAFGYGEHYCLGANLARMELQEIFEGLVTRFRDMERTQPPRRLRSNFINGVKEMRVRFRPGPALGRA